MRVFESSDVRNVALIGHGHCGKTALTSALLFTAGVTDRYLGVDEGNSITDFDEEEIARKLSITSSLAAFSWQKNKINVIDTPGYNIFLNDSKAAMRASDAALILLDGVAGVEVSTEKVWKFAEESRLPCALFVNKLDRERSSFDRAVDSVHEIFGRAAVPVHLPLGAEKNFTGIIDVIRMRAYCYKPGGNGKGAETDIPTPYEEAAEKAHEALIEMIAEGNDELMEEFFATGTLPIEHIVSGLQQAVRERRIFPILCGSALQNIAADTLMNFISEIFPSPLAGPALPASQNGTEISKAVSPGEATALFVFKTSADPFAGRVTYFKVMSGALKDDAHLNNMRSSVNERLAHIATPFLMSM